MPVTVISGPRQAGKTTLARFGLAALQGGTRRPYLTLDDIQTLAFARQDPAVLMRQLPVTIDEIQRAPGLLLAIKRCIDEGRENDTSAMRGAIVLTGSANLALMERVNESLAGRAYYAELLPFCPAEWLGQTTLSPALDALLTESFSQEAWPAGEVAWEKWVALGGFPDVLALPDAEARTLWFAGYLQTYLERDLRQQANIDGLADFQKLMRLAALRTARLLNASELARDAALPQPTVHRYLNHLEAGYQIVRLANHRTNPTTSLIKTRKLMWSDVGFAAWLAGVTEDNLRERADCGFWLEQLVFQSLRAWAATGLRRTIGYWREGPYEVDFVLEQAGQVVAIEVKAATTVLPGDLRGLRAFQKAFAKKGAPAPRGVVLHAGTQAQALGDNLYALPLHAFAPP